MAQKKIFFMGIGGTGMASVAGLAHLKGFAVSGSDQNLYPPMSTMLEELGIPVLTPYDAGNIAKANPDMVIVANALSKDHSEVKAAMAANLPYKSFPQFLGEDILPGTHPIVVTGTHGKTTTSSLTAHLLLELGLDPSYFIGGLQKSTGRSFRLGETGYFVLEGDEYDTAYFDKNSKFLHYRPEYLLLNNLEFDHADIFADLEAIKAQFLKLIALVKSPEKIVANIDDEGVRDLIARAGIADKVTRVSTAPGSTQPNAAVALKEMVAEGTKWRYDFELAGLGAIAAKPDLMGSHNGANMAMSLGLIHALRLAEPGQKNLGEGLGDALVAGLASFAGVGRRLQCLASHNGIDVLEDFAHHPTSVDIVLGSLRAAYGGRRIIACFEPKNASSRRSIFMDRYSEAFKKADQVYIGVCPPDSRVAAEDKMDTAKLAQMIGADRARSFAANEELLASLKAEAKSGDCIVFMSPGGFSHIHHQFAEWLIAN